MIHSLLQHLTTLRRAPTKFGPAPHKPVLLLALIDWIEAQQLIINQIPAGEGLYELFDHNWSLLVDTGHARKITLPLYHLQNDGLWILFTKTGDPVSGEISKKKIRELVRYGKQIQ